ncbi:MAG: hypothetical protein Q9157_004933, partial [Trypethelium eluteriae]
MAASPTFHKTEDVWGPPLREKHLKGLAGPRQICYSTEKTGFLQNQIKKWNKRQGKSPAKRQLPFHVISEADGHPLEATEPLLPKLRLETVTHGTGPDIGNIERQVWNREQMHAVNEGPVDDQAPMISPFASNVSPVGSTDWDWESPETIPKYDNNFKPGKLRRRNALHRASICAKAPLAVLRRKNGSQDTAFERRDSGSIVDEPIDLSRHSQESASRDSTYFTASPHNSFVSNQTAGSSHSSERQWPLDLPQRQWPLGSPNPAEALAEGLRDTLTSRNRSQRSPQQRDLPASTLETLKMDANSASAGVTASGLIWGAPGSMINANLNELSWYSATPCSITTADSSLVERASDSDTYAREPQTQLHSDAMLSKRQEILDHELSLKLQQEEEEEHQRQQEQSRTKTCIICTDDLHVLDFHVQPPTSRCAHPVETCHNCLQHWVEMEFDTNGWEHIKCPQCPELLHHADMLAAAEPDLFIR